MNASDPTGEGFVPPGHDAALSGGEVMALCLKAGRGAGLAWGVAEELGSAARWLHDRGLDGPGVVLRHLEWASGGNPAAHAPTRVQPPFADDDRTLCPLALGMVLSDTAEVPHDPVSVAIPALILPFLARIAQETGAALRVSWPDGRVDVAVRGLDGDAGQLARLDVARISVSRADRPAGHKYASPQATRQDVLQRLDAFALRTTVPPSGASRADAGAGIDDND